MLSMASAIDSYGEFELPEEKPQIEIVENPVQVVNSLYEIFKTKIKRIDINNKTSSKMYGLAEELLLEKKDLKIKGSEIEEILNFLRKENDSKSLIGLFLSALNNTVINTLIINDFSKLHHIGYLLAKDKKLLLGEKVLAIWAGYAGQGVLINNGGVINLADEATDGVQINNGRIATFAFYNSGSPVLINNGLVEEHFSCSISTGLSINNGTLESMLNRYNRHNIINLKNKSKNKKTNLLKFRLQNKISELDFLKNLKNETYDSVANKLDAFDFNKFKQEIINMCREYR